MSSQEITAKQMKVTQKADCSSLDRARDFALRLRSGQALAAQTPPPKQLNLREMG